MIHKLIMVFLGFVIAIFFAQFVFGTRNHPAKMFGSHLGRLGLGSSFSIALPLCGYCTLTDQALTTCAPIYLLSFLLSTTIWFTILACLTSTHYSLEPIPPQKKKFFRAHLFITFFFGGYPAVDEKINSLKAILEKWRYSTSGPQELYEQIQNSPSEAEKRVCQILKITPSDLKQICQASNKFFDT